MHQASRSFVPAQTRREIGHFALFADPKSDTLHFALFAGPKPDISHFAHFEGAKPDTSHFEGAKPDISHFAARTLRRQTLSESVWRRLRRVKKPVSRLVCREVLTDQTYTPLPNLSCL